jgi:fatty acid desaturase
MTNADTNTNTNFANPLARTSPLGGRSGVAIASIAPLVALVLFLAFGFAGGWSWSWVFFLIIPVSGIAVYGLGYSNRRR